MTVVEKVRGTLIRADHGSRKTWHHSVEFDGFDTHETACGQSVECEEFDELIMEIEEWDQLDPNLCCDECAGSVRSLLPDDGLRADGGVLDPEQPDTYRFVVACKECGVCDDETFPAEVVESEQPISMDRMPGFLHYDRTGHTCVEINYDVAPYDIQKMLDDGRLEVLDFERLAEAATGKDDTSQSAGST